MCLTQQIEKYVPGAEQAPAEEVPLGKLYCEGSFSSIEISVSRTLGQCLTRRDKLKSQHLFKGARCELGESPPCCYDRLAW